MCADVQIIDQEVEECAGLCQNGGVCMNGDCRCRKGYSGSYCGYKDSESGSILTLLYYLAVFLVISVAILGLFYGAFMLIKNMVQFLFILLFCRKHKRGGWQRQRDYHRHQVKMLARSLIISQGSQVSLPNT